MAVIINGNGINMGGNPVSNASQIDGTIINENGYNVATDVELTNAITANVNTAGIALKTIATGTATFTATTNNINLTGIGIGVEIGDVIQISGADDAKNNSEFTVEVITDNNNIIVNQAHANKGTTKNVANRSGDTGVTVKLLAKWYNCDDSLGRDWVNVTSSRAVSVSYSALKRPFNISISVAAGNTLYYLSSGSEQISNADLENGVSTNLYGKVTQNYTLFSGSGSGINYWKELR